MDIAKIQQYLSYEAILDRTPEQLFEEVLEQANYLSVEDRVRVKKAFFFAQKHHDTVQRLSGELYMIHPIKVMEFLIELKPDVVTLQVALLHDVIEDTSATYDDVKKEFDDEVAELCVALEKVAKVRYRGEDRNIETLKKTFLAMGKDLRVIFVKLADRVHNIQTLHYHPHPDKRKRIAEETLKVYVPIAKRLGLYVFQGLLENGAFYQLDQKEYKRISDRVLRNYGDVDRLKEEGIQKLITICSEDGVDAVEVLGRLKSPFRIRTKLQKYNTKDVSKVMDVLAFRIITNSIVDCYSDLGAIHKHFTPIFAKMKDYIAIPKPNGYKSLHTTVLGMFGFPVEIQIRTQEMDKIANYGVAAHFAYEEEKGSVMVSDEQAAWIERLQKIVNKYQNFDEKDDFKHELDVEILQKNIFVYTPKGDIIEMPQGSTVLDFAFRVHSDVGLKFKNGLVNSKIVPIDFQINTGDIVDIQTFKNKYTATKSWNRFLHTPSAKTKLNKFIRHLEKEELSSHMEPLINAKLQEFSLPLIGSKEDKLLKAHPGDQRELLLHKLRDKQISITRCIKTVYGEQVGDQKLSTAEQKLLQKKEETAYLFTVANTVVVDGDKVLSVHYCPECNPIVGQSIIGRSGKDGIKIHQTSCVALKTIDPGKLLEAHRANTPLSVYAVQLDLSMHDAPGVLLELLKLFEYLNTNIQNLSTGLANEWGWREVQVVITLHNPAKLAFILKELKNKKQIAKIVKTSFVHER